MFKVNNEEYKQLYNFASYLIDEYDDIVFVINLVEMAHEQKGVRELIDMWHDDEYDDEKIEQDIIDLYKDNFYIRY